MHQAIVNNKTNWAKNVLSIHNGRGSQEAIFAEAKSNTQLEYIPIKKPNGNKVYCLSTMLTHNLHREMQIRTYEKEYGTTVKRRPLWTFQSLATFRKNIIQRAGRLIRPQDRLTQALHKISAKIGNASIFTVSSAGVLAFSGSHCR